MIVDDILIDGFSHTILKANSHYTVMRLAHSMSKNQIQSKNWLVGELLKIHRPKNTLLLGCWFNVLLPYMLQNNNQFTGVDIDDNVKFISDTFNNRMYGVTNNVTTIIADAKDYMLTNDIRQFDVVINTSCEHMDFDMKEVIFDQEPLFVLQSNNYIIPEHINCKNTLSEFVESTGLTNIKFAGQLDLPKYSRFMVIGHL